MGAIYSAGSWRYRVAMVLLSWSLQPVLIYVVMFIVEGADSG